MKRGVHSLILVLGLSAGLVLFGLFSRVGYHADRTYLALALVLCGLCVLVGWFGRHVPLAMGFLAVSGARSIALLRSGEAHHLLFPLHLGIATGLLAAIAHRFLFVERRHFRGPDLLLSGIVYSLSVLLATLTARAFLQSYSVGVLWGSPVVDREIAPGVSGNYALYLALLLAMHIYGPLLVAWAWRLQQGSLSPAALAAAGPDTARSTARHIWLGLGLGGAGNLVAMFLQKAGVQFLFVSTGRSEAALRLPGLLTDSGMSSILLPVLVYALYTAVRILAERSWSFPAASVRLFALLLFGAGIIASVGQGRAVILAGLGLGLYLWWTGSAALDARRALGLVGLLGLLALALSAAVYFGMERPAFLTRIKETIPPALVQLRAGHPGAMLFALDEPRAQLTIAGWQILKEHVWLGSGINSFMVETARLRALNPSLPVDNPANLLSGLLSDVGVLGTLVTLLLAALLGRRRPRADAVGTETDTRATKLHSLPLALLPACLIGYHLVAAEFAAVMLLPLLMAASPPTTDRQRKVDRVLTLVTAGACAIYCAAVLLALLVRG